MDIREFEEVLRSGESSTVEFKRCGGSPGSDTFETVCSFANHAGGSIFLGVADDGTVTGVPEGAALSVERNVANVTGQPQSFSPTLAVETERFKYEGRTVVRVWVPPTSSVFRYKGQVWDRVADADKRIDGEMQITQMYIRKQGIFTERRVYPGLCMADLDPALMARVRTMAANKTPGHPWSGMGDEELLRSARLFARDYGARSEGLTLAAALLLGRDDVIADLLPAYKTDAVARLRDRDRHDDRLVVRTNLIDAYDQLAGFLHRHLPDRFHLEGDVAVSPRDRIVRELVSNVLVHREYSSPIPAQVTVTPEGVETRNASRPAFEGELDLASFTPVPKNPVIADMFVQIGLAEELGSGVRNLVKYTRVYSGGQPELRDGLVFTAFVPTSAIPDGETDAASSGRETDGNVGYGRPSEPADGIDEVVRRMLDETGRATVAEAAREAGVSVRTARRYFSQQVAQGELAAVGRTRDRRYVRAR